MTTKAEQNRLDAIERERKARTVLPVPVPYFSPEHGMLMENRYGLIVPAAVSVDEWAIRATAHQAHLSIPDDVQPVARHARPPQARAAAGAPVLVRRRSNGMVTAHTALDARELLANGNEYEAIPPP